MEVNWCLTCNRAVQARRSSARASAFCSSQCEAEAYHTPTSPTLGIGVNGPIPHLLRAYPATPASLPHKGAKPRASSFASTTSTTSTTSRDEWAATGRVGRTGLGSSSSSAESVSSNETRPGAAGGGAGPFKSPQSAPIHPAAASYIYQPRLPSTVSAGPLPGPRTRTSGGAMYATLAADLRTALPPTPPKSIESRRGPPPQRVAHYPVSSAPQEEDEEEEEEDETAFYGRGHDRAYYYRAARPPPSRYAYLDTPGGAAEPRESRDRAAYPSAAGQRGHVRASSKPIRIVGPEEGGGPKRLVGGFGEEEDEGLVAAAAVGGGGKERGRGRERRR